MKNLLLIILSLVVAVTSCTKEKNTNAITRSFSIKKDVIYGTANDFSGKPQSLLMDVYSPDDQSAHPLVLLIHGGAFLYGDKNEVTDMCKYFVERGFTAVTIDYRLGWNFGTNNCDGNMETLKVAVYRGLQDTHASLRFLAANAVTYKIDTSKVFIGGVSSGSVLALQTAYLDKADVDKFFPFFDRQLGNSNQSGNNLTETFSIKGVINMWGGVFDLGIMSSKEIIPVISFHGNKDNTVPYNEGTYGGCPNYLKVFGSQAIHNLLSNRNNASVLHTAINGGHGVYDTDYIAANSYCFMKSILEKQTPISSLTNSVSECGDYIISH